MIGKVLWQEFFDNVDWPAASAVAVVLVALLTVPLLLAQRLVERAGARHEPAACAPFRVAALVLGFGFLYLPIALLVVYSFNASRLVTVWGGLSTRWYGALIDDDKFRAAALTSLEIARHGGEPGAGARHLRRVRDRAASPGFAAAPLFGFMLMAPLVVPEVILGLSLLLLFVASQAWLGWPASRGIADGDDRPRDLRRLLCRGAGAGAAGRVRPRRSKRPRSISARGRGRCCGGSPCRGSARRWSRAGCWRSRCRSTIWSSPALSPARRRRPCRWRSIRACASA